MATLSPTNLYRESGAGFTPWGHEDHRVFVVTSSPIDRPKGKLEVRSDVDALIAELRALDDGDVWMLGGGQLQMAILEKGAR